MKFLKRVVDDMLLVGSILAFVYVCLSLLGKLILIKIGG